MLIPDAIHPKYSIYYTGAKVLQTLQRTGTITLGDLYVGVKSNYEMSFSIFLLSLDWLFLINAALLNNKGEIELCS